jgi:hypothetical protein
MPCAWCWVHTVYRIRFLAAGGTGWERISLDLNEQIKAREKKS